MGSQAGQTHAGKAVPLVMAGGHGEYVCLKLLHPVYHTHIHSHRDTSSGFKHSLFAGKRTQVARAVVQAAEVLVPECTDEKGPLQKESCT